jgi:hypothetical protein
MDAKNKAISRKTYEEIFQSKHSCWHYEVTLFLTTKMAEIKPQPLDAPEVV